MVWHSFDDGVLVRAHVGSEGLRAKAYRAGPENYIDRLGLLGRVCCYRSLASNRSSRYTGCWRRNEASHERGLVGRAQEGKPKLNLETVTEWLEEACSHKRLAQIILHMIN